MQFRICLPSYTKLQLMIVGVAYMLRDMHECYTCGCAHCNIVSQHGKQHMITHRIASHCIVALSNTMFATLLVLIIASCMSTLRMYCIHITMTIGPSTIM